MANTETPSIGAHNVKAALNISNFIVPNLNNIVKFEHPEGAKNRENKLFKLANTPVEGSLLVFSNGLLMEPEADYSLNGNQLTMSFAPIDEDDKIIVFYYFE